MMIDIGDQVGNYQVVKLIGHGGSADVYLGEHIHLGTQAAIKVLHTHLTSEEGIEKFRAEARTILTLKHPNIVQLLDFGVEELTGTPYLIMEYASGGSLRKRHPEGTQIPLDTVITYIKQVADALQHAHSQKFIHRDVKPENILIGRNNELLLSDFGIAILAQSTSQENLQNTENATNFHVAGTPPYMAPEQFDGKSRPVSDQYGLGVTVYEWLAGTLPLEESPQPFADRHKQGVRPQPLQDIVTTISSEVDAVIQRALEKDPKKRWASVIEFAQKLQEASLMINPSSFNTDPEVSVSPAHTQPSRRSVLRTGLVTLTIMVIGAAGGIAKELLPRFRPGGSLKIQPTPRPVPKPTPSVLGATVYTYSGHSNKVLAVAWSPDGTRIASTSTDGDVHVWDAFTGAKVIQYCGHTKAVTATSWSKDGKRIVSASLDGTVQIWDATTAAHILSLPFPKDDKIPQGYAIKIFTVAWSHNGEHIASTDGYKKPLVWDDPAHPVNGLIDSEYSGHSDIVTCVSWSPNNEYLVSSSYDSTAEVWTHTGGKPITNFKGHTEVVWAVAWSPDGKHIASASMDKTLRIWDASNGQQELAYHEHFGSVNAVTWFPNGQFVASASQDRTVKIWDTRPTSNRKAIYTYRGHSDVVNTLVWSPDGKHIASGSDDRTVQVWKATNDK